MPISVRPTLISHKYPPTHRPAPGRSTPCALHSASRKARPSRDDSGERKIGRHKAVPLPKMFAEAIEKTRMLFQHPEQHQPRRSIDYWKRNHGEWRSQERRKFHLGAF